VCGDIFCNKTEIRDCPLKTTAFSRVAYGGNFVDNMRGLYTCKFKRLSAIKPKRFYEIKVMSTLTRGRGCADVF